jgi:hypothetical protein
MAVLLVELLVLLLLFALPMFMLTLVFGLESSHGAILYC